MAAAWGGGHVVSHRCYSVYSFFLYLPFSSESRGEVSADCGLKEGVEWLGLGSGLRVIETMDLVQ